MEAASGIRILLVDDEEAVLRSLARFLDDCGLLVDTAASGERALELLAAAAYDVAMVDLRLGGMDGSELIARAHELQPQLRYLIFTGSLDFVLPAAMARFGIGPDDVLYKPLPDLDAVVTTIQRMVEER